MSETNLKLSIARLNLNTVLADRAPAYFNYLKQWFRMKSSKEQFDVQARRLLNPEQVHFHNEFLLALLNRVGVLADTSISLSDQRAFSQGKNKIRASTSADLDDDDTPRFDAVDLIDYLPPKSPQAAGSDPVRYAAQERFLPDHGHIIGRFMLAAWDQDLESVEDEAVDYMVAATQTFLKNVITAVIGQRKSYKTKSRFMYDMGGAVPNMWMRNSAKVVDLFGRETMPSGSLGAVGQRRPPTSDEAEHSAALEMACNSASKEEVVTLTLHDVYDTLIQNRNIIASQSVYSINMERIINMMNHPSN